MTKVLHGRHDDPSCDVQRGVERVSERHIARIAGECRAHLAGHVPVSNAGRRIRKAERAAGSRRAERAGAAEAPVLGTAS